MTVNRPVNALAELDESPPGREVIMEEKKWLKQLFTTLVKELGLSDPENVGEQLLVLHEGMMVTYSMGLSANGVASVKETVKMMVKAHVSDT
ncbi:hypothetical protein QTG56_01185 [Rossellomorea sp. AcN35-11]|nr:hypothetical protein [Rossellomorea aquimaris]WJV29812.1 hypothetical protein QTG56_01185 [Rossellomorea sp. AcN35-11]